jgi:hypothetical protein
VHVRVAQAPSVPGQSAAVVQPPAPPEELVVVPPVELVEVVVVVLAAPPVPPEPGVAVTSVVPMWTVESQPELDQARKVKAARMARLRSRIGVRMV